MRSFSPLTVFAIVAFAALAATAAAAAATAPVAAAPGVTPKPQLTSLPTILDGPRNNLSPTSNSITTPNATSATLDPLVTRMLGIVSPGATKASTLASSPLSTNLGTTNATNGVVSTTKVDCSRYFCERRWHARFCRTRQRHLRKLSKLGKDDKFAEVLAKKIGPRGSRLVVGLLVSLSKFPAVGKFLNPVTELTTKTIQDCGTLEQLLSGGNVNRALKGKILRRRDQIKVYEILNTVIPSCVACTVTKLITLLVNGSLLDKLPLLNKLMPKLLPELLPLIAKALGLKVLKPVGDTVHKVLGGVLGGEPKMTDAGDAVGLIGGIL